MPTTSTCDVLIIGAGPAGCMLAACLARIDPVLRVRIVDKAAERVRYGHADGFQVRTVEVFQSLGIAHHVVHEGNEVAECVFYNPNPDASVGGLVETHRTYDTPPGTSYFKHMLLGQGRVEKFLLDCAEEAGGIIVERLTVPTAFSLDAAITSPTDHPVSISLERLPPPQPKTEAELKSGLYRSNMFAEQEKTDKAGAGKTLAEEPKPAGPEANGSKGKTEVVRAKYVVGCDGARSWVRKQIGYELKGDSANVYWGVVDAYAVTDMPTIRMKNVIHSAEDGSILVIPRERGLTRFYVQMGSLAPGQRVDRSEVTVEKIVDKARRILRPYKLECPEVEWFTCYEIGQRICDTFSLDERVFIAGDACHTHSPKAGQGMNISMMDTHNLSWKLAAVLRGRAHLKILKTYQTERHMVAENLIEFDHKFAGMFSGKVGADEGGMSTLDVRDVFEQSMKFASGTGTVYPPSAIVVDPTKCRNDLARNVRVGSHLENHQVVCCGNAHAVQLQHQLVTDGRWRIILFPGDIRRADLLRSLRSVASALEPLIRRYTPTADDIDSVVQVLTVFSTPRLKLRTEGLPDLLQPRRSPYRMRAWNTLFSDDASYHDGHGHAYGGYGISSDPESEGCIIVVRPDQFVSAVVGFNDLSPLEELWAGILLQQGRDWPNGTDGAQID